MLSNVTLKIDDARFPFLIFDFFGGSMVNDTSDIALEHSINPNTYLGGTEILTEKKCSLEMVRRELNLEGNLFVVMPFFDAPFIAKVKEVRSHAIMFEFHSNHKEWFPDQSLRLEEIKTMHLVERISYNMVIPGGCHCAVDGDYCGEECNYPENNPELKGGRQDD